MKTKEEQQAWWRGLTLEEQARYVEARMRKKGKVPDHNLVIKNLVAQGLYKGAKKPAISITNWNDWCGLNVNLCVNADDREIWATFIRFAKKVFAECAIVNDGEETHHLRVDYEHMYPYVDEGGYDA